MNMTHLRVLASIFLGISATSYLSGYDKFLKSFVNKSNEYTVFIVPYGQAKEGELRIDPAYTFTSGFMKNYPVSLEGAGVPLDVAGENTKLLVGAGISGLLKSIDNKIKKVPVSMPLAGENTFVLEDKWVEIEETDKVTGKKTTRKEKDETTSKWEAGDRAPIGSKAVAMGSFFERDFYSRDTNITQIINEGGADIIHILPYESSPYPSAMKGYTLSGNADAWQNDGLEEALSLGYDISNTNLLIVARKRDQMAIKNIDARSFKDELRAENNTLVIANTGEISLKPSSSE